MTVTWPRSFFLMGMVATLSGCLMGVSAIIPAGPAANTSVATGSTPGGTNAAGAQASAGGSLPSGSGNTESPLPSSVPASTAPSGMDVQAALLGTWGTILVTGDYAEVTFIQGGAMLLRTARGSLTGSWSVNGVNLTVQFPGEAPSTYAAVFNADRSQMQVGAQVYQRLR